MRIILIGDVHGCGAALNALLAKLKFRSGDTVVMLGDLFDRGPDSYGVFRTVLELDREYGDSLVLLRGNHEDYLLNENLTLLQRLAWNRVGRSATEKSFRRHGAAMEDARPFLRAKCRLFWKGEGVQAVHAGMMVDPPEANDTHTLVHDHHVVRENRYAGPLTVVGHIALESPTWFKGDGETTEMLEPGRWLPLPDQGFICIDTGCGKGGRLTAMIVSDGNYRLESVPE